MLVPPGVSPHTFEPTPGLITRLAKADIIFKVGLDLEFWLDNLTQSAVRKNVPVIEVANGLALLPMPNIDDHTDTHKTGYYNPHVWLSPANAGLIVRQMATALSEADPANRPVYEANLANYTTQLARLDADYKARVATFKQRRFIAAHQAWDYLAHDYGLEQAASVVEFEGKEPAPEALIHLIQIARAESLRAIFTEPQLSPKAATAIAAETGLQVMTLDPYGSGPDAQRDTYLKMMYFNLEQLERGLK